MPHSFDHFFHPLSVIVKKYSVVGKFGHHHTKKWSDLVEERSHQLIFLKESNQNNRKTPKTHVVHKNSHIFLEKTQFLLTYLFISLALYFVEENLSHIKSNLITLFHIIIFCLLPFKHETMHPCLSRRCLRSKCNIRYKICSTSIINPVY